VPCPGAIIPEVLWEKEESLLFFLDLRVRREDGRRTAMQENGFEGQAGNDV